MLVSLEVRLQPYCDVGLIPQGVDSTSQPCHYPCISIWTQFEPPLPHLEDVEAGLLRESPRALKAVTDVGGGEAAALTKQLLGGSGFLWFPLPSHYGHYLTV